MDVNVIRILPMDSESEYHSNGALETEYLDGIAAVLSERKTVMPKPDLHP